MNSYVNQRTNSGPDAPRTSPRRIGLVQRIIADIRVQVEVILIASNTSRERSLAEIHALAEIITPTALPEPVCRDPDDDEVLARCARRQRRLHRLRRSRSAGSASVSEHPHPHGSPGTAAAQRWLKKLRTLTVRDQVKSPPSSAIRQLMNPPTPKRRPIGFTADVGKESWSRWLGASPGQLMVSKFRRNEMSLTNALPCSACW